MADAPIWTPPRTKRWLIPLLTVWAFVYLPKVFWPSAAVYKNAIFADILRDVASLTKLGALGIGALLAGRSAKRLTSENAVRSAWWLLSAFLALFFGGQIVLSTYEAFGLSAPLPSAGDALFLAGYAAMIGALVHFVRVYRASGFPLGHRYEHAALALLSVAIFAAAATPFLLPIVTAPKPFGERFINVAYPVLDLVALVPTIVLMRITWSLRGGRVWSVWAMLLAGLLCSTGGDIIFAYATSAGHSLASTRSSTPC